MPPRVHRPWPHRCDGMAVLTLTEAFGADVTRIDQVRLRQKPPVRQPRWYRLEHMGAWWSCCVADAVSTCVMRCGRSSSHHAVRCT
jgi:hypothetical protein